MQRSDISTGAGGGQNGQRQLVGNHAQTRQTQAQRGGGDAAGVVPTAAGKSEGERDIAAVLGDWQRVGDTALHRHRQAAPARRCAAKDTQARCLRAAAEVPNGGRPQAVEVG